jgi:MtN3 and saliva related transmembrane protein
MRTDTVIGIIASCCSIISLLPQLIKLYEIKKPVTRSWFAMGIALTGIILWMGYGIIRNDMIIFAAQSISLIISLNFYTLNYLYLKKNNDAHSTQFLLNKPAEKKLQRNGNPLHKI